MDLIQDSFPLNVEHMGLCTDRMCEQCTALIAHLSFFCSVWQQFLQKRDQKKAHRSICFVRFEKKNVYILEKADVNSFSGFIWILCVKTSCVQSHEIVILIWHRDLAIRRRPIMRKKSHN